MKILSYSKRILSLLLICSMLVLACACNSGDSNTQDNEANVEDTKETEKETDKETEKLFSSDMIISGEKPFRIVYSDGYRAAALSIYDRIIALDKNFTPGKYSMVLDTATAVDGTPEILVGDTNRPATEEAKKLITEEGNHFAVYVTDTVISIYAKDLDGAKAATKEISSRISKKNDLIIFSNVKGNYTNTYESFADLTLLEALTKTARDKSLPVYTISVATPEGIETSTINSGNPCQNCYSVTKAYCVTAIGMLFDEGKIDTTDSIGDIFAEEIAAYEIDENKWKNITIHDVLRHRAGFTQGGLLDIDAQDATQWSSQDYLKLTLEAPLDGNKGYKYTDAAYYLISRVVSKIGGQNLDEFLAERLFNKTNCREYAFASCPEGYPIGATGLYIRSSDVTKLGRIYLDGGKYNGQQIISEAWVNKVLENGYELNKANTGYAKGGMRGQYLYINFEKNVSVAWHSYDPDGKTGPLGDTLKTFMEK